MNQTQDAGQEPTASPYLRLPAAVVALALAGLLAVLLAAGLYANANLRPQGEVLPTPAATPVLAAAPVATATPAAVASPTPAAAVTATAATPPPAAPIATVVPTVAPTAPPAAATPGPTPLVVVLPTATVQATSVPTPRPTVSPELQAEVGQAYKTYWQVRAQALYDLDTSHLPEVMAGEHLASTEDLIAQLSSENRAIQTSVSHKYVILDATNDAATVVDEYTDNSFYVDPTTRNKISEPTGGTLKEQYDMEKMDDNWKVVRLIRADQ